ncbi:DNA-directed RNA polymerase subunit D [Candidatus Bathyarchaeota archaeon]|nr:MAG: DNA-directed RNA polymerase subunit D [Candidatus Bathyarchaeota archaeon]
MEVRILENEDNCLKFLINGISIPIANALRRIMIAEVPSMTIDDVIVIENSSPMNDEILALRLGLIPLKTDLDSYFLPEECTCQSELGCNQCSVTLTLEAKAEESIRTVYSKELNSTNPDITPANSGIPILKLGYGQSVRLECYARLGKGKVHTKWQPVSACTYKYASVIDINQDKCNFCKRCIKACPKNVLKKEKKKITFVEIEKCDLCNECVFACPIDAIQVEKLKDTFIFMIESTGALTAERIIYESNKILINKTKDFQEQLLKIKSGEIK